MNWFANLELPEGCIRPPGMDDVAASLSAKLSEEKFRPLMSDNLVYDGNKWTIIYQ